LNIIRPRLGEDKQTNFMTGQYVVGKSSSLNQLVIGTDFHCAGANNWFIQVVGRKRWEFLMPEHSPYLWPLKGGMVNFWNGNENMARDSEHLPREFVILNPGDVLLNPPWQWHKIVSKSSLDSRPPTPLLTVNSHCWLVDYPGFTIGVPIRELNGLNTVTNNPAFGAIVLVNLLLNKVGLTLGGYPPPSAATEHDN
jgi:hypothetical protein